MWDVTYLIKIIINEWTDVFNLLSSCNVYKMEIKFAWILSEFFSMTAGMGNSSWIVEVQFC